MEIKILITKKIKLEPRLVDGIKKISWKFLSYLYCFKCNLCARDRKIHFFESARARTCDKKKRQCR